MRDGMGKDRAWMRAAASVALVGVLLSQLPVPVRAGPYDPGRLRAIAQGGMVPIAYRGVAAAVRLRLPFQAVRAGETALAETRLSFGLALATTPAMGARPGLPVARPQRPLMRLSVDFTGRPDSLRLNGLPLAGPTALAAAEDATEPVDAPRKKHRNRKWWWIGGGVLVAGLVTALAVSSSNLPGDLGFDQQK